jgi:hypothetical protein
VIFGDELVEEVVADTRLDDFGDPAWRIGYDVLTDSLQRDADLSPDGRTAVSAMLRDALVVRLQVVDWAQSHPAVLEVPVTRPIVIVGLARTGTTLLTELLHCDASNRCLRHWEASTPVPPPGLDPSADLVRIRGAAMHLAALDERDPRLRTMHREWATGPAECARLLARDFRSTTWEGVARVASYARWLDSADHRSSYAHHQMSLQVLQSHAPGRWVLKCPEHCLAIDALLDQYPDARLIMTHRDPVEAIGSVCSLVQSTTQLFSDVDDSAYIGARQLAEARASVSRVMDHRAGRGDDAWIDVDYRAFVADPISELHRVYEWLGMELTPSLEATMRAHLASQEQQPRPVHSYRLESFGLTPEQIRSELAAYREQFQLV